jgi:peptide/nickel transport system substrate-binding protein
MKEHKKGIVRIVAATLAAASLLFTAACAGGTGSSGSSAASTDLKVGLTASPANLDMTQTSGAAIPQALMYNVYEGLVKLKDDGKTIEPLLAKSWTVSDDGLIYTFKLQTGVKFSNGDSFDSSTVKYNLERLSTWKANTPTNLAAIDHVETPSTDEAKIVLKTPDRNVLFWLTGPLGAMFDPKAVDSLKTEAVGTGPFTVKSYAVGSKLSLESNASYWGTKPSLKTVELMYYTDTTSCSNALLSGDIDTIYNFTAYDQLDQFKNNDNYRIDVGNAQGILVLAMNSQKAPFNNADLRQAVMYAVDRSKVVDTVLNGYGNVLSAPSIPTDAWYKKSDAYAYSQSKAKALVKSSGVSNPTISFTVPSLSYAQSISQVVKTQLEAVGFTVNLETQEFPAVWLQNTLTDKNYDMTAILHVEPRNVFNYGNADYYWNYSNDSVQKAFANAKTSGSDEEFNTYMNEAITQIQQDTPADWLYNPKLLVVTKNDVSGINKNDVGIALDLSGVKRS